MNNKLFSDCLKYAYDKLDSKNSLGVGDKLLFKRDCLTLYNLIDLNLTTEEEAIISAVYLNLDLFKKRYIEND